MFLFDGIQYMVWLDPAKVKYFQELENAQNEPNRNNQR